MKTLEHTTNGNYSTKGVKTSFGRTAINVLNAEMKAGKGHLELLTTMTNEVLYISLINDKSSEAEVKAFNDHKTVTIEAINEVKSIYLLGYKEHSNETLKKYAARYTKLVTYYDDIATLCNNSDTFELMTSPSQTALFAFIDGFKHTDKGTTPPTEKESDKTTQNGSNDVLNEDVVSVDVDVSKVKEMDAKELQIEFKRLLAQIDIRAVKVDLESIEHEVANQVLATMQTLSALLNTVQK